MSTADPVSRATAEHYSWGQGCDGWHLVRTPGLSVIQERMPAGTTEQRHKHGVARQFFFVLAGRLTIDVEGVRHELGPQTGFEIAPGIVHQVQNDSGDGTDFLVVSQPPSHGDRS